MTHADSSGQLLRTSRIASSGALPSPSGPHALHIDRLRITVYEFGPDGVRHDVEPPPSVAEHDPDRPCEAGRRVPEFRRCHCICSCQEP